MFHNHTMLDAVRVPRVVTTFGCAGTVGFHSPSPNDLTNGTFWAGNLLTPTSGASDPLLGTTATSLLSNVGSGSFNSFIDNVGIFTLTGGTTYTFGAYFKTIAGPPWIIFQASDGTTVAFGSWFNLSGSGAVGNPNTNAGTVLSCAQIIPAGNGYVQVSIGGSIPSTNTTMAIYIYLVDGNGTGLSTLNQQVLAWQVCP